MAAPTTPYAGWNLLLALGGNAVGAESNAVLRRGNELIPANAKPTPFWKKSLAGMRSWSIDFESLFLKGSAEVAGSTAGISIGGTALKGWEELTFELSVDTTDIVDSTTGLDREILPHLRTARVTISGNFYDPEGTGADALADTLAELDGDTSAGLAVVLTWGSGAGSLTITGRPDSFEASAGLGDVVKNSFSFEATGAVTDAGAGVDTGLQALITALLHEDGVQSLTALLSTGTEDYTEWTGTVYATTLRITIPIKGLVSCSGTLTGSGALTQQATSE